MHDVSGSYGERKDYNLHSLMSISSLFRSVDSFEPLNSK
jgi:hypothetical protein